MGYRAAYIKVPSPFSSKVSVRWEDGSLSRLKFGPAIDLVGTTRIQQALDYPGKWIVLSYLNSGAVAGSAVLEGK